MSRWIVAAALVLALAGEARATAINGNELFESCKDTLGPGQFRCLEYTRGVVDMMVIVRVTGVDFPVPVPCFPENANITQLRDIVVRWLEEHPETRHEPALGEMWAAFLAAFPCN